MTSEPQTDTYTMIAESTESLVAEVPIEEANLRIGRLFKGAGVTAIKLSFDTDQHMKEHTAAAPILVQVVEGHIQFTVGVQTFEMPQGAIIHVDAKVPHSLTSVGTAHVLLLLCDGAPTRTSRGQKDAKATPTQNPALAINPEKTLPLTEQKHTHVQLNEDERCECGIVNEPQYPELDVRPVPHAIRHAIVFGALDSIADGEGLIIVAHHDPIPLLKQIEQRTPGRFDVDYLTRGPEEWRLIFLATA